MTNIVATFVQKNSESPFTELFSLLKRYENVSNGISTLAYDSKELKIMYQHLDTVIDIVLQGLQDVGHLIDVTSSNKCGVSELNHIGFFISVIANLTEALNTLRSDADITLKLRGIVNY